MTTNLRIAPLLTASTTLSASWITWLWANPPMISPVSISVGAGHDLAISMILLKSLCPSASVAICWQPGNPVELQVNMRSVYVAFDAGGTIQLVVKTIGPLNDSNSSRCFHHELP